MEGSVVVPERVRVFGSLVKFSHTVFALPFAIMMAVTVSRSVPVSFYQVLLLLICVVSARTAAMAFNRLVDASIDAQNPRTRSREIPAGKVSRAEAVGLTVVSSVVFLGGAALLGRHCFVLAPIVLVILLGYSLIKRYSELCHAVLGLSLALAPGGVWYALTATWSTLPLPLMGAVLAWVAGFDILYSCQDEQFDTQRKLHSVPARFGTPRAIRIAALCHVLATVMLLMFGACFRMGPIFYAGVAVFAIFVASQYVSLRRNGIGCLDQVFFTRNGYASVMLLVAVLIDRLVS